MARILLQRATGNIPSVLAVISVLVSRFGNGGGAALNEIMNNETPSAAYFIKTEGRWRYGRKRAKKSWGFRPACPLLRAMHDRSGAVPLFTRRQAASTL